MWLLPFQLRGDVNSLKGRKRKGEMLRDVTDQIKDQKSKSLSLSLKIQNCRGKIKDGCGAREERHYVAGVTWP